MGRIIPGQDQISIETTLEEMLQVPIVARYQTKEGVQITSSSLYDVIRWITWRMLWLHGGKQLEGLENDFAYGDVQIIDGSKVKTTFFKKRFIPKEPGGP